MKFGKIYTYENRNEAEIGKRYVFSDTYMYLCDTLFLETSSPRELMAVKDNPHPFNNEDLGRYQFIREVLEEKPTLMTNRQLAEWLAKGNGEMSMRKGMGLCVFPHWVYEKERANDSVPDDFLIRPWDSDEWVVPTVDIYERDCR